MRSQAVAKPSVGDRKRPVHPCSSRFLQQGFAFPVRGFFILAQIEAGRTDANVTKSVLFWSGASLIARLKCRAATADRPENKFNQPLRSQAQEAVGSSARARSSRKVPASDEDPLVITARCAVHTMFNDFRRPVPLHARSTPAHVLSPPPL